MRTFGFAARISLLVTLACACGKETSDNGLPGITDYRTYDHATVAVKDAGNDGFALLCKPSPLDRRTGYLQLLDADGEEGTRIDLGDLPTTIEAIPFAPEDLLYTDFAVAYDGSFYVVGTAIEPDMEDRLHLVVQHVARNGTALGAPFRRYITTNAVVVTNDEGDLLEDLDGLPRQRVLCDLYANGDLVVAVRWETLVGAGIRLYRFPLSDGSAPVMRWDHTLEDPAYRLQLLAIDPFSHSTALVVDHDDAEAPGGHGTEVWTTSPGPAGWVEPIHAGIGLTNAEPQQLLRDGSSFLLTGYVSGTDGRIDPFVSRFTDAGSAGSGTRVLDGLAPDGRPVAAYCAGDMEGRIQVMVQSHQGSAVAPYFSGDITSDLAITELDGNLGASSPATVIPGQGLRAIAVAEKNGKRIVIGTHHPFLNVGYLHTFYMVLE